LKPLKPIARIRYLFAFAGFLAGALPGHSSVLFDNGAPLILGGGQSITHFEGAENFPLSTSATIEGARIYLLGNYQTNTLTWTLYGDGGSIPGAVLATGTNPTWTASVYTLFAGFIPYYQFDFDLPSVSLAPGTYWLGVSFSGSDPAAAEWVQSTTSNTETEATRIIGGSWGTGGEQLAFEISGTPLSAPEPVTSTFLISGFLLMFAPRLRRKGRR
jgi:hypothetical protein